mgnify:CR=1 FL=1
MDAGNNRVLRYILGSTLGTIVVATSFSTPRGMRLDPLGNIFITDFSHRVYKFICGKLLILFNLS